MDAAILISAFQQAFSPLSLALLLAGTLCGTIVGALPGLGGIVAITIALPFTYQLPPASAIGMLMGVYCGAIYGGSISAILQNIPGTPQSAATCFDGFPMARQGKAGEALGWATISSVLGGLFSCIVLIFIGPSLASLSKHFGPIETFALITMALTCIAGVSRGSMAKGLMSGCMGLFLGTIGIDPIVANSRFIFDIFRLSAGVDILTMFVGIFAIAEVLFRAFEDDGKGKTLIRYSKMKLPGLRDWKGRVGTFVRSAIIGTGVGILPGTGATAAVFISYADAKRSSPFRDKLGEGEPAGIIAPETANNAVTGGALIPTLALGIPGDAVTAIMMATLVQHGLTPGVRLMRDNPDTVMSAFILLFMANLLLLPVGMLVAKAFAKILRLPEPLLMAGVTLLCVLGVYSNSPNSFNLKLTLAFGLFGFIMRLLKVPVAPLVIGFILSNQLEISLRQALILTNNRPLYFLKSPVAVFLLIATVLMLAWPIIQKCKHNIFK